MRQLKHEERVAAFGDPAPYMREDGTVDPKWELHILTWAKLPAPLPLAWDTEKAVTRFLCHKKLVRHFEAALERVHSNHAAWRTLNDFNGCYSWDTMRGKALSPYCWGAAVNIDFCETPDSWVVGSFEMFGFLWGGRCRTKKDPQRFEFSDIAQL